jgi:hypothetical protein
MIIENKRLERPVSKILARVMLFKNIVVVVIHRD